MEDNEYEWLAELLESELDDEDQMAEDIQEAKDFVKEVFNILLNKE